MQELEENIQFDTMPDFGGMFSMQVNPDSTFDEKEYSSLYEELVEKCHPDRFIDGDNFNEELFEKANMLYAEILRCKDSPDEDLISLRNQAIELLGVHISTKKKYEYLNGFLNPKVYTDVVAGEYDAERVSEAAKWYTVLQKSRNNIRALEALEIDASSFIDRRNNELSIINQKEAEKREELKRENERRIQKEEEKKLAIAEAVMAIVFTIIGVIVVIIANK